MAVFPGVFLHMAADTLGSIGVIIASALLMMQKYHLMMIADPVCSVLIALLTGVR